MDNATPTRQRVLDAALLAFGTSGFAATSLDALAEQTGVRKQTILYYFESKQVLFDSVIDAAAQDLVQLFDEEASRGLRGIDQVEAIVRRIFRLAVNRPELLGLVREVTRPGSITVGRLTAHVRPTVMRARHFLEREMNAGRLRYSDPAMLLLSLYSTVVGVASELEVQRAMGIPVSRRATVNRRLELTRFLRAALAPIK